MGFRKNRLENVVQEEETLLVPEITNNGHLDKMQQNSEFEAEMQYGLKLFSETIEEKEKIIKEE